MVPAGRPSRIALLLALAHHWERLVREGVVKDYADIARLTGLTRARVTQVMNLTLLAPAIQEKILFFARTLGQNELPPERHARALTTIPDWNEPAPALAGTIHLLAAFV